MSDIEALKASFRLLHPQWWNEIKDLSVNKLSLSTKTKNNLKAFGLGTVGELTDSLLSTGYNGKLSYFSWELKKKMILELQRFYKNGVQ